ncbi:MAG: hypothetical protein ACR2HJ_01815 [Fimbriimonadales bacterium]
MPFNLEAVKNDLAARCPNLLAYETTNGLEVVGGHPVIGLDGNEITRFSIKVVVTAVFPDELPLIFETANRIPRVPDRHINEDGSCCIGVAAALRQRMGRSFRLSDYVLGPMSEYFLGQALVDYGRPWPAGEARHGELGVIDFWLSALNAKRPENVLNLLTYSSFMRKPRKNSRCPCGLRKRARACHLAKIVWVQALYSVTFIREQAEIVKKLV